MPALADRTSNLFPSMIIRSPLHRLRGGVELDAAQ